MKKLTSGTSIISDWNMNFMTAKNIQNSNSKKYSKW
jgi:hypothetical protein